MLSKAQEEVAERMTLEYGRCVARPMGDPDADGFREHLIIGLRDDIDVEYVIVAVDGAERSGTHLQGKDWDLEKSLREAREDELAAVAP